MSVNIIHIGLSKCASTLMQKYLFTQHPEINYIQSNSDNSVKPYNNNFMAQGFASDLQEFNNVINNNIDSRKVNLLSQEGFSGNMITGQNSGYYASALYKMYPKAKIVIVIREQVSYLYSVYRHMVSRGETYSMKKFINRYQHHKELNMTNMPGATIMHRLQYDKLVSEYINYFGRDNVLIILFEDLLEDFDRYIKDLYNFIGVSHNEFKNIKYNVGIKHPEMLSLINFFTNTPYNNGKLTILPVAFQKAAIKILNMFPEYTNQLKKIKYLLGESNLNTIKKSNCLIQGITGIDLKRHNYIV